MLQVIFVNFVEIQRCASSVIVGCYVNKMVAMEMCF